MSSIFAKIIKSIVTPNSICYNKIMAREITATTKATVIAASFAVVIRGGKAKR